MQRRMKMNHRRNVESVGMTSKPGRVVGPGQVLRKSVYCQGGVRRKGGVSAFQACLRNLGTCRSDAKGEVQVEAPRGPEYRCGAQGRITPYERRRFCNGTGAKGVNEPAESREPTNNIRRSS